MAGSELSDPTAVPVYRDTPLQRAMEKLLYDPRDVVFLRLFLKATLVMGAFFALFFLRFSWLYVAPFAVAYYLVGPPVILMLHCTMHRPFFKRHPVLSRVVPYTMSFFLGIPCGYMEHHIGMHHPENNVGEDLSATLRYRRDSFLHFLEYFFRFFFLIHFELTAYMVRKKRAFMGVRAVGMEMLHVSLIALGLWLNWRAALCCMVAPFVLVRFMMMAGNWGQHAFIDPRAPADSQLNSINCIHARYNKVAFNDGYHIVHHEKPALHWTEMPAYFEKHKARYAKSGAIVFKEIDFFIISLLLWFKRYDVLASKLVTLDGVERSADEKIAFLKSRTLPVTEEAVEPSPAT